MICNDLNKNYYSNIQKLKPVYNILSNNNCMIAYFDNQNTLIFYYSSYY